MNKQIITFGTFLFCFGGVGLAQASLVTIGTATYNGSDYKLIWDNDNNGKSVIWLDYRNPTYNGSYVSPTDNNWTKQIAWASGLEISISAYNIDSAYSVTWDDANPWRLPTTVDGPFDYSITYDGIGGGFNVTYSELGHLFYTELGNKGYFLIDGTPVPTSEQGIKNKGDFVNFGGAAYWYSTPYSSLSGHAWVFGFSNGYENANNLNTGDNVYGIALRTAQVTVSDPVPEPATMILFGTGLAGLAAARRRKTVS